VLRRLRAIATTFAVVAGALLGAAGPARADGSPPAEVQFVSLINQLRASRGVAVLVVDPRLVAVARMWAAPMSTPYLHHNPNIAEDGPPGWIILGENVGVGPDVASLQQAFTNSPEHYANMVEPRYNAIGLCVVGVSCRMWVAEE
jgi:uncharacterized protein YkwD